MHPALVVRDASSSSATARWFDLGEVLGVGALGSFARYSSRRFEVLCMINLFPHTAKSVADALWIDLYNPEAAEIRTVASALSISIPERAELEEIESSSRLQIDDGLIQMSLPVAPHGEDDGPTPVGFILSKNFLITVRYTEMRAFETAAQECEKQKEPLTNSVQIFAAIIEGMVDYGADMLEEIANALNDMSGKVFRRYEGQRQHNKARSNKRMREILISVGQAGERLSQIRESIVGLQRAVPYALENSKDWMEDGVGGRLKTVGNDLQSLSDFEVHLSNKVQFLLDAVLGFINTEQNDIFKVLTIGSVVGIPPTFIASMYGMNFHNMPEYTWKYGYEWGLFLIFLSTILPIIWFKWRGWW
jgi:magnesium transporter